MDWTSPRLQDALAGAMGYHPDRECVEAAVRRHAGDDTNDIRDDLGELAERFEAAGGRGCELADRIDRLRMALAVREAEADITTTEGV